VKLCADLRDAASISFFLPAPLTIAWCDYLAGASDRHQFRDGSVVVGKILEHDTYGEFDPQTAEFGNLVSKRIIDPTKVWFASRCKMGRQ
jgi:hypothetical protein